MASWGAEEEVFDLHWLGSEILTAGISPSVPSPVQSTSQDVRLRPDVRAQQVILGLSVLPCVLCR